MNDNSSHTRDRALVLAGSLAALVVLGGLMDLTDLIASRPQMPLGTGEYARRASALNAGLAFAVAARSREPEAARAIAAREAGISLSAHSDGPGAGAVFTVEIPRQHGEKNND